MAAKPGGGCQSDVLQDRERLRRLGGLLDADTLQLQLCLGIERVVDNHDVACSNTGGRRFEKDLERAAVTDAHDERIAAG